MPSITKNTQDKASNKKSNLIKASSIASTGNSKTVTHEQIASRAYEIFKTNKGGNHLDHWLQAEQELKSNSINQKSN